MTTPATSAAAPEPTHGCVRCGRPVPIHVALCEECNPLGLRQPSATQVHAIAAGGIVLFVAILAVLAGIGLQGVGPFTGAVTRVEAADGGLSVTIRVTNDGTRDAATTCRLVERDRPAGGPGEMVQTPTVEAGGSVAVTVTVSAFGDRPQVLAVDCQSP
ncbi:MAG TPA: hypothetical protein VLS28_12860 [Candidatus Sulfomarinibacteraceae bacterium]|nr:hypothetical protein [Candidatus Sulfomarinibacteraceae bacterium]